MLRRLSRIVGLSGPIAAAACFAAPAAAGVAELERYQVGTRDGGQATVARIVYTASPGEANQLSVTYYREPGLVDDREGVTIRDTAGVVAGSGCSSEGNDQEVRCDFGDAAPADLRLSLGDEADAALVAGEAPPPRQGVPVGAVITGGPGDDHLKAGAAYGVGSLYGVLDGGAGDDVLTAGEPVEFARGFHFRGGAGNDRMVGGSGEDLFVADSTRDGRDTMVGGGKSDTVSYETRSSGVRADLEGDRDDGARGERDRIATDIENLIGGAGSDRLSGDRRRNLLGAGYGRDLLAGRGGDDDMSGGAGPDVIEGGRGLDFVTGGAGNDQLDLRDGTLDDASCGHGRDRILLDQRDFFSNTEGGVCEIPERSRAPVAVPVGRYDVLGSHQRQSVTAIIGCPGDAPATCTGEAEMVVDGRSGGPASLSIEADHAEQVEVPLASEAWERFRRGEMVTGQLVMRVRTPRGDVVRLAYAVMIAGGGPPPPGAQ